jgi:hypothetical protein
MRRTKKVKRQTLRRVTALQARRRAIGECLDCGRALRASPPTFTRCPRCRRVRATAARARRRDLKEGT